MTSEINDAAPGELQAAEEETPTAQDGLSVEIQPATSDHWAAHTTSWREILDQSPLTREHWKIWFLCAMGIFIDGFDLFVIAVALPLIAQDLTSDKWLLGLIGAAAPLGAMVGAATLGVVTDKIGRKAMYMIDLCIFVVFSAFCVFAWNVWSLIAFRFLLGVGVGADYPISSSYIAEFMPSRVRGKMLAGAFSFQALGSVGGALTGLLVLSMAPDLSSWRLMLGAGIIPAVLVMFLRHNAPESPRWLMSQGRMKEAGDVISVLTGQQVCAVRPDDVVDKASAKPQRSWRLLLAPQYLRRTLLALVPWFLLDIALYAVGTFTPSVIARLSNEKSLHATTFAHNLIHQDIVATEGAVFLDLFLVIGFVCSIFLVEKVGRMRLQMFGFTGMTVGLLILSWAGALPHGDQSFIFVFLGFALFNLLVNMGPNATTYLVAAELFPTDLRATAHGLAAAAGKVGAVIGIFFLPISIATFGLSSTMAVVAGVGFLGFLVTWMFGIETAGASLEQLSAEPANPTVKLIVT